MARTPPLGLLGQDVANSHRLGIAGAQVTLSDTMNASKAVDLVKNLSRSNPLAEKIK